MHLLEYLKEIHRIKENGEKGSWISLNGICAQLGKKNEARAMPKRPGLREEANLLLAVNPGIVSQKGCCSSCHHNRDPHRKKKVKG